MDISGKDIRGILEIAVKENASDIFIVAACLLHGVPMEKFII